MFNNGSTYSNGNSFALGAVDDRVVRSLPWLFRVAVPGMVAGWPR
jgi:hypothetical protein